MAEELDAQKVRAVLREHGHEVPARGKLSAENIAVYKELTSNVRYLDAQAAAEGVSVTGGDFGPAAGLDEDDGPGPDMAETTPRGSKPATPRERRARSAAGVRGLWSRARDAGKGGKGGGKRHKWVSTAEVIEDFWGQLAWAARPIPPLAKILACQAPTAGVLLEDASRDTLIDRVVLQPAARSADKLRAVNAMVGPPVFTAAIAMFGGAVTDPAGNPVTDEDGMYVFDGRTQPLVAGLRFSLMSWLRVGGKRSEEIIEAAEESERLQDEADKLIRFILAAPDRSQSAKDAGREAEQMGRDFLQAAKTSSAKPAPGRARKPARPAGQGTGGAAHLKDGFGAASQDQVTGALEQMAASSAFRPAPATGGKT